jgi:3-hydroxybutyryl-CoA dehydratase
VRFEELTIGQAASVAREVTATDVETFAAVTGDANPVHLDEEVAARSRFGGRIAHGMLSAGYISAALGTELPGPGCIYLGQTLRFVRPVRIGDTVTTHVQVTELVPEKRRVKLATRCANQRGETVVDGEATVLVPEDS